MSPREYLEWAAQRALYYFDQGEKRNAVMSFYSDMHKADDMRWICDTPMALDLLEIGYENGREAFKEVMLGFNV